MADTEAVQLRSAWMSTAEYDPDEKTLEITLDDGKSYEYSGVPSALFQALLNAPSPGRYFVTQIKNRFPET